MVYNALFHSTFIFRLFLAEFIKFAENLHYVEIPSTSWLHYVVRSSRKRYHSPQILLVYANCMCLRSISGAKKSRVALYVSASRRLPWNQTLSGLTPIRVGPRSVVGRTTWSVALKKIPQPLHIILVYANRMCLRSISGAKKVGKL